MLATAGCGEPGQAKRLTLVVGFSLGYLCTKPHIKNICVINAHACIYIYIYNMPVYVYAHADVYTIYIGMYLCVYRVCMCVFYVLIYMFYTCIHTSCSRQSAHHMCIGMRVHV